MNDNNKNSKPAGQSILETADLERRAITIPEWNFEGYIQEINGEDAFAIASIAAEARDDNSVNVHILEAYVCAGLLDSNGDRVFAIDDRAALAKKKPAVIERLYSAITELSGITDEQVEETVKK